MIGRQDGVPEGLLMLFKLSEASSDDGGCELLPMEPLKSALGVPSDQDALPLGFEDYAD